LADTLTIGLNERSYRIHFGDGILATVGTLCRDLGLGKKVAVITNPTVGSFYRAKVTDALAAAGFDAICLEIPDGEEYKSSETLNGIYDGLIDNGLDRGSFILALGGGVVGDIAGYAAASYLRGIPFVQVPTSLLAQVDSSVGGKTGINHRKGKNLIGAFYQPRLVLIDAAVLDTLPEREYLNGLGEVIKYGVAMDRDLFSFLCDNAGRVLARDRDSVLAIIRRSCALKASVVEQDEREAGLRAVLNYGHTMGHAVETLTGYTLWKHGEAVAIGMVQAARFSEAMGFAGADDTAAIIDLLRTYGLPVEVPAFSAEEYAAALFRDKKVRDGGINFVFNKGIGNFHMERVTDISPLLTVSGIGG